jgi:hypothetical protein
MIKNQIVGTELFDSSFSERLNNYVKRRNRVVHSLFSDTFKSKQDIDFKSEIAINYVKECEWIAQEGSSLVEVGFGIYRVLGNILKKANPEDTQLQALLKSFDEFELEGEKTFKNIYRPHLKFGK